MQISTSCHGLVVAVFVALVPSIAFDVIVFVLNFAKGVDFARNRLSFANSLPTRCLLGDKPASGCICLLKQTCKDFSLCSVKADVQLLQNEICLHLRTLS